MNPWLISTVFALFIGSASSQLTTWDNQLFDFGWSPYNPTITRCSVIPVSWSDRTTANPASTPPYTISVFRGADQPIVIATEQSHGYNWTVGLPVGGPYVVNMRDANGYTGGNSLAFTVEESSTGGTCPSTTLVSNGLQLTSTGTNAECSAIVVTAAGGTAPYTMQIMAAQRPPKTTTWSTPQMSYTIDIQSSEQFFVVVTDANGLTGVDGIHTVANGNTGCYNLATTVSAGSLPTTLSYNPSSTVSYPSGSTSSQTSSPSVIQNTATTTVVSTVIAADGSQTTITLAPGASTTLPILNATAPTPSATPAIIGGAVGGAVLLLFFLFLFLWWRRRAARVKQARERELYERRRLSDGPLPMPVTATFISPFPPYTPGRDTAPLMGHMGSTYSANSGATGSAYTPAPSTPGMSYFGGPNNLTTHEESQAWVVPATSPNQSHYGPTSPPLTASSSIPARSASVDGGLPPGAMMPQMSNAGRIIEKATFVPAKASTVAPPPYSQGA